MHIARMLCLLATIAACDKIFGLDQVVPGQLGPDSSACGQPSYNPTGCACETPTATQACFHGVPGAASACTAGVISCSDNHTWGPCVGGTLPAATDTCFDGVDNECDGIIDNGCKCSAAVDLCSGLDPNVVNAFVDPANPAVNSSYDIYVLSKNAPKIGSPAPNFDFYVNPYQGVSTGTGCQGGANILSCPNVGAGCTGWWIVRKQGKITVPAVYTLQVHGNGGSGCPGSTITTTMFNVN